jgi:uncharacterized membrane protein
VGLMLLGLALFLGIHSIAIVAPAARDRLVAKLGAGPWKGLYSLVSIAGFYLIVVGFGAARAAPVVLYSPPALLRYVAVVLMLPVFPMALSAYFPGRIQRALKHPLLAATKTWALAHLLANGTLADVVLFGALLAWAVADRISLKRRAPRAIATAPPGRFNDALAVVLGLALYAAFLAGVHRWLIGVAPLG